MALVVCDGATLRCSFGQASSALVVPAPGRVFAGAPVANVTDFVPFVNVSPFGACSSPVNPAVAAAMGAPQPCAPQTVAPWIAPGQTNAVRKLPVLQATDRLICLWGGAIEVVSAGQTKVMVK